MVWLRPGCLSRYVISYILPDMGFFFFVKRYFCFNVTCIADVKIIIKTWNIFKDKCIITSNYS